MSSQLLFLNGQISVLEGYLLDESHLDRMIGAPTPEKAFGVLSELSYADYFDESLKASSFSQVLSQGLRETQDLINENLESPSYRMILWLRYDLNNLKRAAKDRFLFGEETLSDFTDHNGYSDLGNLSADDLYQVVYELKPNDLLPRELFQAVVDFADQEEKSLQRFDQQLDEAYLKAFARLCRSAGENLKAYAQMQIDLYNLRGLFRGVTLLGHGLDRWIAGGTLHRSSFETVDSPKDFIESVVSTDFAILVDLIKESLPLEQQLHHFETLCDRHLLQTLKELSLGNDGLAKIMYYFQQRWLNARMIKVIMFGKFYGLEPTEIEAKLKHVNP